MFESFVHPEILLASPRDEIFEDVIDALGIQGEIVSGKFLQGREKYQFVPSVIGAPACKKRDHGSARDAGKARGRGIGCSWHAEERREDTIGAAETLIGRVPDDLVLLETPDDATHVFLGDGLFVEFVALAAQVGANRIFVSATVGDIDGVQHRHQTSADFQRRKMGGQQNHAVASGQGLLHVFEALRFQQGTQSGIAGPPAQPDLEQTDTERAEVLASEFLAIMVTHVWEAESQIGQNDMPVTSRQSPEQVAESTAKTQLGSVWQGYRKAQ